MGDPATRPCAVCGQPTRAETGVCQRTAECRTEHRRRYRQAKPEVERERQRRRRKTSPEAIRREKARHYAAHREQIKGRVRAWQTANAAEISARRSEDRVKNPEYYRVQDLRLKHGMRPQDWAALHEAQAGLCYLCGGGLDMARSKAIAVDHDHKCCPASKSCMVCRRGLACSSCNLAIGMVYEDPARLRRMADALEAAQRGVDQRRTATSRITLFG